MSETTTSKTEKTTYIAPEDVARDDQGRYATHELPGYDQKIHLRLVAADFSGQHHHLRHRALLLDEKANALVEKSSSLRSQADVIEKQPNARARKLAARREKMMAKLNEIEELLQSEGLGEVTTD